MPSRRGRSQVPDAKQSDSEGPTTDSDVPISLAEAEQEVSRAEARAKAARARAAQLRRQAEADSSDQSDTVEDAQAKDSETAATEGTAEETEPASARSRRWRPRWVRRPARKTVAVGVGILLAGASLAASGYMVWQHHAVVHKRPLAPEFAAAARQGITTLMSIDPKHVKEDIQRSIDASTGDLKAQLEARSALTAQQAEEQKLASKVTIQAVGVESVTDNSGVVLVSAKSDVTNPDNTKRPPMLWRISVNIERDGGQLKMSRVDFLR